MKKSIYILDDLRFIENHDAANATKNKVFPIAKTYRVPPQMGGRRGRGMIMSAPNNVGANPPKGVVINYWNANTSDSTRVMISILDDQKRSSERLIKMMWADQAQKLDSKILFGICTTRKSKNLRKV